MLAVSWGISLEERLSEKVRYSDIHHWIRAYQER